MPDKPHIISARRRLAGLTPAATRAYKRLVQFMHTQGLGANDRLPVQQELRERLKLTNDSMTRAMRLLCEQGIVERRTKVGTQVLDLDLAADLPWTVGLANIAAPSIGPLSTFTTLSHHLQVAFSRAGWDVRTYYRFVQLPQHPRLGDFDELDHDLAHGNIDGLVTLTTLNGKDWERQINQDRPLCHTPFWEEARCGVVVDQAALARDAVGLLAERGCRTFAAITESDTDPFFHRFRDGMTSGLNRVGLPASASRVIAGGTSITGGRIAAEKLLALPSADRPHGLIIFDDYIALGVTEILSAARSAGRVAYHPLIVVQTSREVPQNYHLPIIRLEVSLQAIANLTADLIRQRMLNPASPERVVWVEPVVVDETPHGPGQARPESDHSPGINQHRLHENRLVVES